MSADSWRSCPDPLLLGSSGLRCRDRFLGLLPPLGVPGEIVLNGCHHLSVQLVPYVCGVALYLWSGAAYHRINAPYSAIESRDHALHGAEPAPGAAAFSFSSWSR